MDENSRQKIALFRSSLIAPIITDMFSQKTAKEYLEEVCAKEYDTPQGMKKEYTPATLKKTGFVIIENMVLMVYIQKLGLIKVDLEKYLMKLRTLLFHVS
ncbi:hypothetical protein [Caloranaerobacter sp. DY30410]|uniref:hypothetical protein n=1 Tax=Caloranaerobacter sp. DY30410 TaxID=3238305 RepID=UPI003D08669F